MSDDDRVPADLLLLRERRRRMTPASIPTRPVTGLAPSPEPVLLESDAIVDGSSVDEASIRNDALHLYRPLESVTLAQISWTGAIDHATLQTALACSPPDVLGGAPGFPWPARTSMSPAALAAGEPALHVALTASDVRLLESAVQSRARPLAEAIVLASALPASIVGLDASTADAALGVLTTYRRASLVFAWLAAIGGGAGPDATSRRDEAAALALSLLRALLGEA